jgi:hypothetical protein
MYDKKIQNLCLTRRRNDATFFGKDPGQDFRLVVV